jgi:hypothetical protein
VLLPHAAESLHGAARIRSIPCHRLRRPRWRHHQLSTNIRPGPLNEGSSIGHIKRIVADAATLQPDGRQANSALITMVLHHADDPAEILRNVVRFVPRGAPIVIGEFHPDGPCTEGPPRNHRLAPEKVQEWCKDSGLAVVGYQRQTPEHYFVVAQRRGH